MISQCDRGGSRINTRLPVIFDWISEDDELAKAFCSTLIITAWFANLSFVAPVWIAVFALLGAAILGTMGVIAGIWAEKFDQLAAFQNFLIMPATFLSGVFYSIKSLPPFWLTVSHFNPFFYMIDGFRHGFFGQSDVSPWTSLAIVSVFFALLASIAINLLKRGYKLRH